MANQKRYTEGKIVEVLLLNTSEVVTVNLKEHNRNGIVCTDKNIGGGKLGIFIPYSNIGNITEVEQTDG